MINENDLRLCKSLEATSESHDKSLHKITMHESNQIATNHIKESYQLWTYWRWLYTNPIGQVEQELFERLNVQNKRECVLIGNGKHGLWTLSVNTHLKGTPIVLIHGFCGGIGLWAHNVKGLSVKRALYAFDLLGFGRSSRTPFSNDPQIVEQEFVQSIEEWRCAMKLEKMIIIGHSFGGYLSSAYSLKYPHRVEALILADPWGFTKRNLDIQLPMIAKVFLKLSQFSTPLFILRFTGSFGLRLFQRWRPDFRRKFQAVLGETDLIYNYLFHVNQQVPTGEVAFKTLSDMLRYAKRPMDERILSLDTQIPLFFVYGGDSWMERTAGDYVQANRENVTIKVIDHAGHHVYADQPEFFNDYVNVEILNSLHKNSC